MAILVFLNGDVVKKSPYYQVDFDEIIAVDGGYDKIPANLLATRLIGDLDSIKSNFSGEKIMKYQKNKDYSDFELTLNYLSDNYNQKDIIIFGITGGRMDHQLFNLFVLKKHMDKNNYMAETANEIIFFLNKSTKLTGFKDKTFSIFPFEKVRGLTIKGGLYPLDNKDVDPFSSLTLSNVAKDNLIDITIRSGSYAVFINKT